MDPARWRQVEEIFHRALEHEGSARAAFLDEACSDPEMRGAVEALLTQSSEGQPAAPAEALTPGTRLGPYRVEGPIGAGGMGAVYKAVDTRLNRPVAIKVAAARFSARFKREAHAIAALNHPYVCTLYDVGPNYLVMEYVEGSTLNQVMRERRLPIDESLQYASEIASAMQAAHAARIVHRDLKPGNVMITKTGLVKVLDFGLAQMSAPDAAVGTAAPEATMTITGDTDFTRPGTVIGSPRYMSPEQALGRPLDARSDVFSFGALFYEMLAGKRAFGGESTLEVISGVIHKEVPPPSESNPEVGPALDELVGRCLRKEPAERFSSMTEVRQALKALDAGASATITMHRGAAQARSPRRLWWVAAAAGAVVLATGLVWWKGRPAEEREEPAEERGMNRITTDRGLSIDATISEDGKLVAFASDRSGDGNLDIWVQQIGGGDPVRVTHDEADDLEPNFSPDGRHIVFRSERNGGGVYIVPTTGGRERRIADGGRRPQYSPDGNEVVYWTGPAMIAPLRNGSKVFIVDVLSSAVRPIQPDFLTAVHPVWSPDGRKVLFVGKKEETDNAGWWIASLNGGAPVRCLVMPIGGLYDPIAWQNDWVYLIEGARRPHAFARRRVELSTGKSAGDTVRLSALTADAQSAALSKTGRAVVAVVDTATNLYSLPVDAARGQARGDPQAVSKSQDIHAAQSISTDGTRVAYLAHSSGRPEVWALDLSSGRSHAITEGSKAKGAALISGNGEQIVWMDSDNADFVTSFDGSQTRQICSPCGPVRVLSPDGTRALAETRPVPSAIATMRWPSGEASVYLKESGVDLRPRSLSSDGKWLAFTAGAPPTFTMYVAPYSPSRPPLRSEWIEIAKSSEVHPDPTWSPDGGLLYFSSERDGHNCIWAIPLDPRSRRPTGALFAVRHFHTPSLQLIAPSRTFPTIALARDRMVVSLQERSGGLWMVPLPKGK